MLNMGSVVRLKAENGNDSTQKGFVINVKDATTFEVCLLDTPENPILEFSTEQLIPTGEKMMNILQWPKSALEHRRKVNANNGCAQRTEIWN